MSEENPIVQRLEERLDELERKQGIIIESFRWLESQTAGFYGLTGLSPVFAAIADKLEP